MRRLSILFFLLFFVTLAYAEAYTVESVPNPQKAAIPSFVSDPDQLIDSNTKLMINQQIDSLWRDNDTEIAVVILSSIGFEDENDFANRLYNHWGIGGKTQSNGVLLLVVLDIRSVVIRVGVGVEGVLPDAIAKRIISQEVIPEFRNENYALGIQKGIDRIVRTVREEPFEKESEKPINWKEVIPYAMIFYILLIIFTLYWMRSEINKIHQNKKFNTNLARYSAIKSHNSATFALVSFFVPIVLVFVIIIFWRYQYILLLFGVPFAALPAFLFGRVKMKEARTAAIPCNECGSSMHMLSEKEEDTYLKISQQFEEKLKSIDYDVFLCNSCKNEAIFTLDKVSNYSHCPRCNTKAYKLVSKKTVVMPTYVSSGTERSSYKCEFCGYEEHKNKNLPRLRRSAAYTGGAVGGSMFSGRGGFGGGFGGGGFGGGFSGGGGASGRW